MSSGGVTEQKRTWYSAFDELKQVITGVEPYTLDAASEPQRVKLQEQTQAYVREHFPSGVAAVYPEKNQTFVICIVDNKFNPANYWSLSPPFLDWLSLL